VRQQLVMQDGQEQLCNAQQQSFVLEGQQDAYTLMQL
jgi:hypothetical protein